MTATLNPYTAQKEEMAFPRLTDAQLRALTPIGQCRLCRDGDVLFEAGDRGFAFYVVIHGHIRIVERRRNGEDLLIARHGPGEFTGDVDVVTGRPTLVAGICEGHTDVIEIKPDAIRRIVAEHSDLGEIILRAFLMRRQMLEGQGYVGTRLIGSKWSRDTFRLKDFLSRNQVVFTWIDVETDENVQATLDSFGIAVEDTPVVICPNGTLLKNPTERQIADCLGLRPQVNRELFDLVVIGGGPAGLAAAVYGASEGLKTLVVEAIAPGGQAGTSSKIENYLGFPTGVSGADLTRRATIQAQKFGAVIATPQNALSLGCDGRGAKIVDVGDGESVLARAVVVATGANYRRIDAPGAERFEGNGVFYGATPMEAAPCRDETVIVVGGGNSAGQAAVFLSGYARRVIIMVRRGGLAETMSKYLIDRIEHTENIELRTHSQITRFHGSEQLESVTVRRDGAGEEELAVRAVFTMIGADPRTDWLKSCIALDDKGFVATGNDAKRHPMFRDHWSLPREPFLLETSRPGIFAAGDVRSGSIKRVASAVGEGSMAIKYVHEFLATQ